MDTLSSFTSEGLQALLEEAIRQSYSDRVLHPWKAYTVKQVADLFEMPTSTVYKIPENELPRRYVGPRRGSLRFLGADLMCYLAGEDPVDFSSLVDELRRQVRQETAIKPGSSDGRRRIL